MKKKNLVRYFNKKKPVGSFFLTLVGLWLCYMSISNNGGAFSVLLSLGIVAIGGLKIYSFIKNETDQAVDEYCRDQEIKFYKEKKKVIDTYKVSVEDEISSSGYLFENMFSARSSRKGKDGIMRSSILGLNCTFITTDMIYHYNKRMSLITDEKFENQCEFCIKDIQMVSIEENNQSWSTAISVPGGEKIHLKCEGREAAMEICERIKAKL